MAIREKVDSVVSKVLIVIMAIMVINVLWQVFTRFIIGTPSSFTDELSRYLMIWLGILGAAYVSGKRVHVAIDVLPQKFSEKVQKRLMLIVYVLIIIFAFFAMVIGGLRLVYITYVLDQYSPALQVPLAAVYFSIPLSGALIIFYKILDILNLK